MCASERAMRKTVQEIISEFLKNDLSAHLWKRPLIGYADAKSSMIRDLKDIVSKDHLMPNDILSDPTVVISYFIPFDESIGTSNISGRSPSNEWIDAYVRTNDAAVRLNVYLISEIEKMGFHAASPAYAGMNDELKSIWSQRHIARAAGLGSFGINNMLISESGCCGRYFSIVTDLPITPDEVKDQACLYKIDGSCTACVKRCRSNALTAEDFDRYRCLEYMNSIAVPNADADICGKCVTGLPCSFRRPQRPSIL